MLKLLRYLYPMYILFYLFHQAVFHSKHSVQIDLMRQPILLDGRNAYDPQRMKEMGFIYRGMGRGYSGEAL